MKCPTLREVAPYTAGVLDTLEANEPRKCPKCGSEMYRFWRPKEGPDEKNFGHWGCDCGHEEKVKEGKA